MRLLQFVFFCISGRISLAKPDGAPSKSCTSMSPGHLKNPLERNPELIVQQPLYTSVYVINATWDSGRRQHVRLSITGSSFQGFLIQARETEDGKAVGNFKILSNDTKYQNCDQDKFNSEASVTHTDAGEKENVTLLWAPSFGIKGNITFYATIAKTKLEYWIKLPSNTIYVSSKSNRRPSLSISLLSNVLFLVLFFGTLWT